MSLDTFWYTVFDPTVSGSCQLAAAVGIIRYLFSLTRYPSLYNSLELWSLISKGDSLQQTEGDAPYCKHIDKAELRFARSIMDQNCAH
jgi:hypothetical protein